MIFQKLTGMGGGGFGGMAEMVVFVCKGAGIRF
jgi:hypothetical protein